MNVPRGTSRCAERTGAANELLHCGGGAAAARVGDAGLGAVGCDKDRVGVALARSRVDHGVAAGAEWVDDGRVL